ncbi:MAG: PilZ domain-containing protein, partial [Acidobacteria bacterium]|nr:PilZ domain-containing protein [Acidobacteriota bacterium]
MTTTGLVISNDLILRGETRAVLSELEMACTCSGFAALERTLRSAKFDCIFLDFDDRDKALAAIEMVRRDRMNRYAIVFALSDADCEATAGVSYSVRRSANFQGELKRSFLAARSLVLGEKRRYQRHPVDIKIACVCGDRTTQARIIDLSERGACVAFPYAVVVP